ncbi:hypothetical protein BBU72A_S0014 (plasmid) [Borreliella burgdorferi 72a]|uniref:Uncharacterized protein n=1 Tax=Borreliella burgdorferi 118a TaxID=476210 RepID=A0A7U4DIT9_BORBG|nr:hypothetical protein BBU72A_S0014 [Borreliella burgdorferi 72a]ACN92764.1 conserved hypothetical protein [Borreliella burgdorferi 118a]
MKNLTKIKKETLKLTLKFYLTLKTSKLIIKYIKTLKQTAPISDRFIYLLLISGCGSTEL